MTCVAPDRTVTGPLGKAQAAEKERQSTPDAYHDLPDVNFFLRVLTCNG